VLTGRANRWLVLGFVLGAGELIGVLA